MGQRGGGRVNGVIQRLRNTKTPTLGVGRHDKRLYCCCFRGGWLDEEGSGDR